MTQSKCVGELFESLVIEREIDMTHINIYYANSKSQFQADLENPNACILQIDFALSYSWEYQNEIQGVVLLTTALTYKLVCKIFICVSHDKGKDTLAAFVDFLWW